MRKIEQVHVKHQISSNTNHDKLQVYYSFCFFLGRSQGYFAKSTQTKKPMVKPPQQSTKVEWFVSHWWGTSVATYCSALRRHAYEVKVGSVPPNSGGWFGKVNTPPWDLTYPPSKGTFFKMSFLFPTNMLV